MGTLKDIINGVRNYSDNHVNINSFGWGNITNLDTNQHPTTIVWLQPTPSTINGNINKLRFDLYVIDLLEIDLSNLETVMVNTLAIGNDIIQDFWFDEEDALGFTMDNNVSFEPFDAKFDIYTAGYVFNIEIEMRTNHCKTPIN